MWAIWTARTWERARTAARSPHPYAQWMLWHGSEIKLRTLGRFCQRGSGRWGACVCVFHLFMWTWVFHKRTHAPWLSEVLVISLLSPLHTYVSVRLSICLSPSLSDSVYPLTACWPQSGKLRIHGTSQHFEKVQSCRPKRLREAVHTEASMWVSFIATITPVHPTLMLPACCGRRYRRVWSHLTESRTAHRCPGTLWECNKLSVDLRLLSSFSNMSLMIESCIEDYRAITAFTDVISTSTCVLAECVWTAFNICLISRFIFRMAITWVRLRNST